MYENIIYEMISDFRRIWIPEDLIERELFDYKEIFVQPRKITIIAGMRRVGKTYALYQLIKEVSNEVSRDDIYYLNFEDERLPKDKNVLSDLSSIIKAKKGRLRDAIIFLDEIHEIPEWDRWLFRIYELEKPPIVITGSSSKLVPFELPRILRGRSLTYVLYPLRFREFLKFKGIDIPLSTEEWLRAKILSLLDEYLTYGGLPEVVLSPTHRKLRILQDYYWTIITKDIAERKNIEKISMLNTVLKYVINTTYFSATKLHNILKSAGYRIGKNTILEYIEYAKEVFFINQINQYQERASQRIIMPRKTYVGDNGFITALATKKALKGRLLENAVYIELQRRYFLDPTIEISYILTKTGEIDFVITKGIQTLELIQVTYDPTDIETKQREIAPLIEQAKRLKPQKITVITANYQATEKYGTKIINYIPYPLWENTRTRNESL